MEILTVGPYRLHSGCLPVLRPLPTSAGATMSSRINRSTPCQSRFQTPPILQGASRPVAVETAQCCQAEKNPPGPDTDRRHFMALATLSLSVLADSPALAARERRPTNISEDAYKVTSDGLKYFDFVEGKGEVAEAGKAVSVHFDCIFKTLTVVSSREAKLLGGNRTIAQPYNFVVGSTPGQERKRDSTDSANGLFSAQAAPKPPRAMYSVVQGMKVGGKRTVVVPPREGYGDRGFAEIPPGATFTLNLELLEVKA